MRELTLSTSIKRRPAKLLGMLVLTLWMGLPLRGFAQDANHSIDDIKRVWRERQEKVRTARFNLDCKETIHKGSADVGPMQKRKKETGDNPPRDYPVEGKAKVAFDGGKLHYSYDMPVWDPKINGLYQDQYDDVFDGELFKSLQNPASGAHNYPLGTIVKAEKSRSAGQFSILPLLIAFRGEHDQFVRDLGQSHVAGQKVLVASRPCIEVIRESRVDDRRDVLYLDAERGYLVVRKLTIEQGISTWQLDIAYGPDPIVGWVPKSWSYVIRTLKPNRVYQSGSRLVSSYDLNGALASDEFDMKFPIGARVLDQSSGKEVQYVIQDDGQRGREISSKSNPTYRDLQLAKPSTTKNVVLFVSAIVFLVALGSLALLHWRRRRTRNLSTASSGPMLPTSTEPK